jgi:hypothetical protein
MKSTLYDLTSEGLAIFDMLSDNLGELTPELEERLDKLMLEGPERLEAAAMVVQTLQGNVAVCEAEADRLRQRAKAFDAQVDSLKKRMTACLDTAFNGKVKTPLFNMYTQKSADRTVADLIPGVTPEMLHAERPDLVRVKMELNREVVVAAWKAGDRTMPELIVFEEKIGGRSIRIK